MNVFKLFIHNIKPNPSFWTLISHQRFTTGIHKIRDIFRHTNHYNVNSPLHLINSETNVHRKLLETWHCWDGFYVLRSSLAPTCFRVPLYRSISEQLGGEAPYLSAERDNILEGAHPRFQATEHTDIIISRGFMMGGVQSGV